jgi:hypothetical protein
MSILLAIRIAAWLAFICITLVLVAVYLFPSMRGPNWTNSDLLLAAIFALLAIALKP